MNLNGDVKKDGKNRYEVGSKQYSFHVWARRYSQAVSGFIIAGMMILASFSSFLQGSWFAGWITLLVGFGSLGFTWLMHHVNPRPCFSVETDLWMDEVKAAYGPNVSVKLNPDDSCEVMTDSGPLRFNNTIDVLKANQQSS